MKCQILKWEQKLKELLKGVKVDYLIVEGVGVERRNGVVEKYLKKKTIKEAKERFGESSRISENESD